MQGLHAAFEPNPARAYRVAESLPLSLHELLQGGFELSLRLAHPIPDLINAVAHPLILQVHAEHSSR